MFQFLYYKVLASILLVRLKSEMSESGLAEIAELKFEPIYSFKLINERR